MNEQIDIWLVGNTGLRNPNRIQDGFKVFAGSPYVGNLHGKENEIGFMNYLNEKGIIQNEDGKDESGSHARKWRLMFAKNGFIYPQVKKKDEIQEDLGLLDDITPFGRSFLKADTYPAVQECYLRAMSVEQFALPDGIHYFSPLRWLLAIMLELEKRTGTSELSRIEFALWGHTTNPSYNLSEVVDSILDLRKRRAAAPAKRPFDKKEIAERGKNYDKKADNFLDYSDKLFLSQLKYFFPDFLSILGCTFNPFTVFNNESKFSMYSGKLLASGEITPRLKTYILCEGRW